MKTALITGITGQDGPYLAELLLEKDYKVYGLVRRTSSGSLGNAAHLEDVIEIVQGDLTDKSSLDKIIRVVRPHEIYNYAAQSHVGISFKEPIHTASVTALGPLNLLESIHSSGIHCKFLQASTSEMFGGVSEKPINEDSVFSPRSPYAAAKCFAHHVTQNYREAYRMFNCSAIAFNHSSCRRGKEFATRKITSEVARIAFGLQDKIYMGNLSARRDESHAKDIVRAQWLMLQQLEPQDLVLGSGETISIQDMLDWVCKLAGLNWRDIYVPDPSMFRPTEVNVLLADASRARKALNWEPKYTWRTLLKEMYEHDASALGK